MLQHFGKGDGVELAPRRVEEVHFLQYDAGGCAHRVQRGAGILQTGGADVPAFSGAAIGRGCRQRQEQPMPRPHFQMRETLFVAGQEDVAKIAQHFGVVAPP